MDLNIKDKLFLVGGATSGFGRAVALQLVEEGAKVIAVARGNDKLTELAKINPDLIEPLQLDLTDISNIETIQAQIGNRKLSGALINAGGPPAMSTLETTIQDWDDAYHKIIRWKVALTKSLVNDMIIGGFGRFVFVESVSVKQPIENLVLSNAMRLGIVGFVKTMSQEIGHTGVTMNILAPSYHATPAMDRLFAKKSEVQGISVADAQKAFESEIKVGYMGKPEDFASLATWLFSPHSRFITGQTISVDGGTVKGIW